MLLRTVTAFRKAVTVLALLFGGISALSTALFAILTLLGVEDIAANRTGSSRLPVSWEGTGIFALFAWGGLGLAWLLNPWWRPRKSHPPARDRDISRPFSGCDPRSSRQTESCHSAVSR